MAIKLSDLSRELKVSNEDIMDQLQRLYVDFENEDSDIDDKIAGLLRLKFGAVEEPKAKAKKQKKTAETEDTKPKTKKASKKEKGEAEEKDTGKKGKVKKN
ncbi:MAG: hypothetical protein ABH883_01295 [Candidatus Omnitrophota bacterium]